MSERNESADLGTDAGTPPSNRFTADAWRLIVQLRAVADELSKQETDPAPLTSMEIRLARHTSALALERAAVLAEAFPGIGGHVDIAELRETIAFELAYGGVYDEARVVARRIEHIILRRKLKSVKAARALYRMAKAYVTLDSGDAARPLVEALKQTLVRPRRRK